LENFDFSPLFSKPANFPSIFYDCFCQLTIPSLECWVYETTRTFLFTNKFYQITCFQNIGLHVFHILDPTDPHQCVSTPECHNSSILVLQYIGLLKFQVYWPPEIQIHNSLSFQRVGPMPLYLAVSLILLAVFQIRNFAKAGKCKCSLTQRNYVIYPQTLFVTFN
jgi:hypothetical protein